MFHLNTFDYDSSYVHLVFCLVPPNADPRNPVYCKSGEVSISRLDDVLRSVPVWILHIDVRGFEPAVIAGAEKLLTREVPPKYLMFAVEQGYSKSALGIKVDFATIIDWLIKIGYNLKDKQHEMIKGGNEFLTKLGHDTDYVTGVYEERTWYRL